MSNVRISNLPNTTASAVVDTDILPISIGVAAGVGVTSKIAVSELRTKLGVTPPAQNRTVTSASTYLDDNKSFNVRDYGAVGNGVTDDLPAFNLAITNAQSANWHNVYVPPGDYRLNGTLVVPAGITVYATETMGEYDSNPYTKGARLIRVTGDSGAVPLVQLSTSSAMVGCELRWQKSGGALQGILRMSQSGSFITYARFKGVIRGTRTGDINGTTTCYGIFFPNTADAKYFNDIDAYVTECDVSAHLGQLANANRIVLMSREAHCHLELNAAAGQAIENDIYLRAFAITILSPALGVKMRNTTNNKIRGIYEAYGTCFDVDSTNPSNDIDMSINEASPSYIPSVSTDSRYMKTVNHSRIVQMLLPTKTTGDRDIFGRGNSFIRREEISGTLPNVNDPTGTLTAAGVNNKVIINLGGNFNKPGLISFKAKLSLWAYVPFNHAMKWVEVEFLVRNTNPSVPNASLSVTKVTQKGTDITGLYFLTGVTGATNYAVALVMGNLGSATPPDAINAELEITALTYSTNVVTMTDLANQVSFATAAVTANDVTNKISLLTVADTAF